MRLLPLFAALAVMAHFGSAAAEELAFGSETWRGHAFQLKSVPLSCRVFSRFGNGDNLAFVAILPKGGAKIEFMAFLTAAPPETERVSASSSISVTLALASKSARGSIPASIWVDDDGAAALPGTADEYSVMFPIGTLDTPTAAKFFNAIRDGTALHVSVAGQDRKYVLRGSFAALSELVGCAVKARDGEIAPSRSPERVAAAGSAPQIQTAPSLPPVTPSPPVEPVASSVPLPPRPARREVVSSGSGIIVTTDGHVLTNYHVAKGCSSFGVRRVGDAERRAALLAHDAQNDLALLKTDAYPEAAAIRVEPPRLAEMVLVYGFPLSGILASSGNVTIGNVSALTGLRDDSRDVQITAAVQPGNSGGPVFDASGLLLGVVQSKLDAIKAASVTGDIAQNVNFAIRGSLAVSFLGANGIEPAFERRRAALPADDVSDRAQKITVQVLCYGGDP